MDGNEEYGEKTLSGRELAIGALIARIAQVVGSFDRAQAVFAECVAKSNLQAISSSQDMLCFCSALAKQGGELEKLSGMIISEVIQAILQSAHRKLVKAIGDVKANEVFQLCFIEIGQSNIATTQ